MKKKAKKASFLPKAALAAFLAGAAFLPSCISPQTANIQKNLAPLEQRVEKPVETKKDYLENIKTSPKRDKEEIYALLISGLTENRHKEGLETAYKTLTTQLKIPKEKIRVLDNFPNNSKNYPVFGESSKEVIIKTFNEDLSKKIGPEDTFILYITDHGFYEEKGEVSPDGKTLLKGGGFFTSDWKRFYASTLKELVRKNIPTDTKCFFVFDFCYGGPVAKKMGTGKIIAVAPQKEGTVYGGVYFSQTIWESLIEEDDFFGNPSGKRIGDVNKDGLAIKEIFDYAKEYGIMSNLHFLEKDDKKKVHNPGMYYDKQRIDPSKFYLEDKKSQKLSTNRLNQ
ncbi:MAG: hypothetical protein KKF68_03605 [Nanoarchaeota archaeon]|nr:hypothetical protein [Nanoarchaeota archaeon]